MDNGIYYQVGKNYVKINVGYFLCTRQCALYLHSRKFNPEFKSRMLEKKQAVLSIVNIYKIEIAGFKS